MQYAPDFQGKRGVVQLHWLQDHTVPGDCPIKKQATPNKTNFSKETGGAGTFLAYCNTSVVLKKTALHTYLFMFLPVLQLYFSWDKCHEQTEEQLRHAERFLQKSTFYVCYSFNPFHNNLVWWLNSDNLTIVLGIVSWFHNHNVYYFKINIISRQVELWQLTLANNIFVFSHLCLHAMCLTALAFAVLTENRSHLHCKGAGWLSHSEGKNLIWESLVLVNCTGE